MRPPFPRGLLPAWGGSYLSVVEVAEASNLLGLVEDVALDFHLSHDAEFAEVPQQVITGDFGLEGDGVLGQFEVFGLALRGGGGTSWTTASVALAKENTPLRMRLLMELSIISTGAQ